MNTVVYNINFGLQWERILPPLLRSERMLAWGRLLLYPLQQLRDTIFGPYLQGEWLTAAQRSFGLQERMGFNAQTLKLEYILNKSVGVPALPHPQIFIEQNHEEELNTYFYNTIEKTAVYFSPAFKSGTIYQAKDTAALDAEWFTAVNTTSTAPSSNQNDWERTTILDVVLIHPEEAILPYDFEVFIPQQFINGNTHSPAIINKTVEDLKVFGTRHKITTY